ncbi:MAG: maleylacetate reductase, partial [Polyangiaceae bacterium]
AVGSIAGFARALPRLAAAPREPAVRSEALEAAYLAGASLAEAAMGLHHKICHVLGGRGMPHAPTHAALLPHVVRFNREAAPAAMARIANALGTSDAAAGIVALAAATHAPSGLASLGLPRDAVDEVVRDVLAAAPPNPRPLDAPSLRALLLEALEETHAPA